VLSALPQEVAGLLALIALVLLPGLVVVRAPWTVVPALSMAFWTLTWWWVAVVSRSRTLTFALAAFALLAALRLVPKHVVSPPPGYTGPLPPPPVTGPLTGEVPRLRSPSSLAVVAVSVAALAPLVLLRHVPGREMAFHTTAARVTLWRDALPVTYEPLLPLAPFGAHAPALPTLAADVSLLSGLDPGRSVALVTLASVGLLLLGLFALLSVGLRPPAAALAALLGLAAVRWPGFFAMWGEGGSLLALGMGVSAAALLLGHTSRPSAVAAGMLLAAAALAQPLLAALAAVGLVAVAVVPQRHEWNPRRSASAVGLGTTKRLGLAFGVSAVLGAPGLWRTVRTLSAREAWAVLGSLQVGAVMDFVMGLVVLVLVAFLAARLTHPEAARGGSRVRAAVLMGLGAALLLVRVTFGLGAGQVSPASLRQLEALEGEARPLEAVCAPEGLIDWVPGLAGRTPGQEGAAEPEPWAPPVFRDEWRRRPLRPCSTRLD